MVNIRYANAYSEVLEILKYIPIEDYNKIPQSKIEVFEKNKNKEYKFVYNPNKTLEEQNVSEGGQAIIGLLFRDYWATDTQKEKIIEKQNYDRQVIEKQKSEGYNSNNIFKRNNIYDIKEVSNQNIVDNSNLTIYVKKQKIFQKIITYIKKFFNLYHK